MHVHQYALGKVLGKGTFGTVRIATAPELSEPVAVKVFTKSLLSRLKATSSSLSCSGSRSQGSAASSLGSTGGLCRANSVPPGGCSTASRRFMRRGSLPDMASAPSMLNQVCSEIAIMKKFHHRNITRLIEVVDDPAEDRMYLVMEFVDGGVVKFEEARGPEERAAYARSVFRQLMMALEYMHCHNVCHRDIKPENMLLTGDGVLKVTDFGVSVACEGDDDTQLKTAGTPAFMPPEACTGSRFHGKPADVWAAGVSLYYLATGRLPFKADCVFRLYEKIGEGRVEYPEGMEPRLRALLERVLERDPERRATVAEIREHAWMTDSGASPMPPPEARSIVVTEEEHRRAIRTVDRVAALVGLKGKAHRLHVKAAGRVKERRWRSLKEVMSAVLAAGRLKAKAGRIVAARRGSGGSPPAGDRGAPGAVPAAPVLVITVADGAEGGSGGEGGPPAPSISPVPVLASGSAAAACARPAPCGSPVPLWAGPRLTSAS
eukprot:tig00000802_g4255.t1